MDTEPTSTVRARRLRERRSRGVVMVAPVEVGEGGKVGLEIIKAMRLANAKFLKDREDTSPVGRDFLQSNRS